MNYLLIKLYYEVNIKLTLNNYLHKIKYQSRCIFVFLKIINGF